MTESFNIGRGFEGLGKYYVEQGVEVNLFHAGNPSRSNIANTNLCAEITKSSGMNGHDAAGSVSFPGSVN